MAFNRYDILTAHYTKEIESWDWNYISKEVRENCFVTEDNEIEGRCYLGSVLGLAPSGKIYAMWTSNQTRADVVKDECYFNALNQVAEQNGLYTSCEDDGFFAGKGLEYNEVIQFITSDNAERALELYNELEEIESQELESLI